MYANVVRNWFGGAGRSARQVLDEQEKLRQVAEMVVEGIQKECPKECFRFRPIDSEIRARTLAGVELKDALRYNADDSFDLFFAIGLRRDAESPPHYWVEFEFRIRWNGAGWSARMCPTCKLEDVRDWPTFFNLFDLALLGFAEREGPKQTDIKAGAIGVPFVTAAAK